MSIEKRIDRLEHQIKSFNLVLKGANIQGGFPELAKLPTVAERVAQIQAAHEQFAIFGGKNATCEGGLKTGVAINFKCPPAAGATGGISPIIPPPPPPPTGACCGVNGYCSITSEAGCAGEYQGDDTLCDPNPCPFDCGTSANFTCVGVMCDTDGTGPSDPTYTSVFDLSPGSLTPDFSLSGTEGPSDLATLDWYADITPDGLGGHSVTYGGTVTGRYGGTQAFGPYSFTGTCGVLTLDSHTERFCGSGSGNCSDIFGCTDANTILAFDSGMGFSVSFQLS